MKYKVKVKESYIAEYTYEYDGLLKDLGHKDNILTDGVYVELNSKVKENIVAMEVVSISEIEETRVRLNPQDSRNIKIKTCQMDMFGEEGEFH